MVDLDLERLMKGTITQLKADAEYFSSLTSHNPEKGRLNETHLVKLLRRYLPPKFGIGTGFIVSGGEKIKQSHQCDVIIYDAINNTPFYSSDAWQIYPIEMVYGVIEVKTTISKAQIKETLTRCSALRKMAGTEHKPNKSYIRQTSHQEGKPVKHETYKQHLAPRFFLFGYSGPSKLTIEKNFKELTKEISNAHIHGFCTLDNDSGLYISHIAFRKSEERVSPITNDGLWRFLMSLPEQLNSMLPVIDLVRASEGDRKAPKCKVFTHRLENFDLVDINHYRKLNSPNGGTGSP